MPQALRFLGWPLLVGVLLALCLLYTSLLIALLATCSLSAAAADNWKPFPLDQSAYDYSGDRLRQALSLIHI